MEWLPFPKTKQGWFAAICLIFGLFILYYVILFGVLRTFYETALYTAMSGDIAPMNCEGDSEGTLKEMAIRISMPRHMAPFGARWFFITIYNNGQQSIENVRLWVRLQSENGREPEQWNIPSLFGGMNLVNKSLEIERIEPHSVASGRLPVYATFDAKAEFWLSIFNECTAQVKVESPHITINLPKYLAHSLVENVLLPPWSNGVLIGIALLACSMAESEKDENRKLVDGILILRAIRFLSTGLAFILLVASLPWLCSKKGLLLLLVSVLALVLIKIKELLLMVRNLPKQPILATGRTFWTAIREKIATVGVLKGGLVLLTIILMVTVWEIIAWRMGRDVETLLEVVVFLAIGNIIAQKFKRGGSHADGSQSIGVKD